MDDFALLVSPTVLLSAFVSPSVTRVPILPRFFFSSFAQTRHGRRSRTREREREKKTPKRNHSLEKRGQFLFHKNVRIFQSVFGFGGAALRSGPAPLLSSPSQSPRRCIWVIETCCRSLRWQTHCAVIPNLKKEKKTGLARRRGARRRAQHRSGELFPRSSRKKAPKKIRAPPFVVSSQSRVFSALPSPSEL